MTAPPRAVLLRTPPSFMFQRTVLSHGWASLPPFRLERARWELERDGWTVREASAASVAVAGRTDGPAQAEVARCLNFDVDLTGFYEMCTRTPGRGEPDLAWVPLTGAGRLLRSPTVFEDLVKMVCTTNCSWSLTERMVSGLVDMGGDRFPTPAVIAEAGGAGLRDMSFGYRAEAVAAIATAVAEGRVEPEAWLDPDLPGAAIRDLIRALPGCGPYVADNVAKLCGHFDGLGLDSWVRAKLARLVGRRLSDRQIAWRYRRFGAWRGLAAWCEVTADWIVDGVAASEW
ncbi:MAG: Fe-S cluster assembly protein HesB [Acidimicrobiia bacterium]|nr:Fe-S cluster assembly protein HesB [Acidimicrobiia bacterium]